MTSATFHESVESLSEATRDMHRAISSLMEEFEAVDWYNQRINATSDEELKAILTHNRDEEKEHAAMVLEWIRRRDPRLDEELRSWLFSDRPLAQRAREEAAGEARVGVGVAEQAAEPDHTALVPPPSFSVGGLRGKG